MRTSSQRTLRRAASAWLVLGIVAVVAAVAVAAFVAGRRTAPSDSSPDQAQAQAGEAEEEAVQLWTCSMHPQIKQTEPGLCPLCGMELIPLETDAAGGEGTLRRFVTTEAAKKLMDLQTAAVERKFVATEVRMVGTVEYDETRVGYITAWIPGRLDRLYVDYTGVRVREGDHMVYMYSPEIISAQQELLQAIASRKRIEGSELPSIRESAENTVRSAREKLRLLGLTREQIEEIEARGTPTDHITIYAPMGGVVIHKNAQEGMYVQTGTRIYTIADLSQVWVQLDAYESDLPWLHYGQKVTFRTESYPGEAFVGKIAFIHPYFDAKTRTVKVRVNVPNEDRRLKPDMFVRAEVVANVALGGRVMDPELAGKWMCPMHPEIVKETAGDCDICGMPLARTESLGYVALPQKERAKPLVIPATAPLITGKRAVVYVEDPTAESPTFDGREIVLGPRAGDYYIVKHGLEEGERVVSHGAFKIDSSLQIQAKPSMMTPEAGAGGSGITALSDLGVHEQEEAADEQEAAETIALVSRFWSQLEGIQPTVKKVGKAIESGNLEDARDAFLGVGQAIDRIAPTQLTGPPRQMWDELAMLIKNAAVVGGEANDLSVARRAHADIRRQMERARDYFAPEAVREAPVEVQPTVPSPPKAEKPGTVPAEFQGQLADVFRAYLDLHSAMVENKDEEAAKAFGRIEAALEATDMALLEGPLHMEWMRSLKSLNHALESLKQAENNAGRVRGFAQLSDELAAVARLFGTGGVGPLYRLHCPMALDGRGADWLQTTEATSNPFFEGSMLKCGSVQETIEDPAGGLND